MNAQQAILTLGTLMLTGCGAALVLIHSSNPLLKGLNWMGMALLTGGVAAGLLLTSGLVPSLEALANLFVFLAFLFCYRADRLLIGLEAHVTRTSLILLGSQVLATLLQWTGVLTERGGVMALSVVIPVQLGETALMIHRFGQGRGRRAAQGTVLLMVTLLLASLSRGVLALFLSDALWTGLLHPLSYGMFVGLAMAMAFAFFWRTTTKLSGELEHMASTDPLTRVFNRRVFLTWCESEQARSQRHQTPFSVVMLDFDHFKSINDTYGHHVGDQVLCAAVERIQDSIRGIDVLCRWGGEEFTVLLPNASEEATLIVAERVRRNIRLVNSSDPRFSDEAFASLQLTASLGTATFEGDPDTYTAMLQRADEALYEAKRAGRNTVIRSTRLRAAANLHAGQLQLEST